MNELLQLKGTFEQSSNKSRPGLPNIPVGKSVNSSKLEKLLSELIRLDEYWLRENILPGELISVFYNKIAAKSNRIQGILSKGSITANSSIVGARFSNNESPKHIITHYVSKEIIKESIYRIKTCINILNTEFGGKINNEIIKNIITNKTSLISNDIAKSNFLKVVVDAFYADKFDVLVDDYSSNADSIITIFKTDIKTKDLLEKIGIDLHFSRVMDETTILLRPDELEILKQKAPYLISMAVSDINEICNDDFSFCSDSIINIPPPTNEPVIGVIDTLFDKNVYFSEWVDYERLLPESIPFSSKDYRHGTAVSSIIVDGPSSNPNLDDGCGRFRVRHFGVAAGDQFSSFSILRNINEIISSNKDIKVWNLSLGSKLEINQNFISPEAAILDKIQYENDVIFIIAGTNNQVKDKKDMAIGAPADSINSLVVNSVDFDKNPASYTRSGPVLSFFTKPDISYYGGDKKQAIRVCTPTGEAYVCGTSFAAPWISRKMSYLIDILGLSREVAKALIINSSAGWDKQIIDSSLIGHGIVPIHINDIVKSRSDEIEFFLSGTSEKYDTYNFNIPVPINKEKHPFISKATLCYFPRCSRNQGVDYTNTELDIQFGRIADNGIKPINNNYQSSEVDHFVLEKDARRLYRKWDNIKHIREVVKSSNRNKKVYEKGLWGISIRTKERLEEKHGVGIKFGIVVTLKSIDGLNYIEDFIKNCCLRGWLVNKIDIENKIDIYNIAEEEITFED